MSSDSANQPTANPDLPAPTPEPPTAPTSSSAPTADDEPLVPNYAEKKELERFLSGGHQTHSYILLYTFIGVILFLAAMLYWEKLDYYPNANGEWAPFGAEILPFDLRNQTAKETAAYQLRPTAAGAPAAPQWPLTLYRKHRFDLYIVGGIFFLLAWVIAKIEGAKAHRRELLILRALLRENEKQRLRLAEVEKSLAEAKPRVV